MWPISTRLNKPENDDPSVLEPVELAAIGSQCITTEVRPISDMAVARRTRLTIVEGDIPCCLPVLYVTPATGSMSYR